MKRAKIPRIRLDRLLVERGLADSQEQAQALILSGTVLVGDHPADKAGIAVPADTELRFRDEASSYVSRGGLKLRGALDRFGIAVAGLTAMDVGASTGGFTDCLLQAGAAKVYAIDVGYGLLAWKLRKDQRVVVIERTNIRYYDGAGITDPIDLAAIDVSFISLKLVIPPVVKLIGDGAIVVALIKPQFEVGKGEVGSDGVVLGQALHLRVIAEIEAFCQDFRLTVLGSCESPLVGPAGNREFFICLKKQPDSRTGSAGD